MKRLLTAFLVLVLLLHVEHAMAAEEPKVQVETHPQWTAGDLAIYILGFPNNGGEYSQDTILIRVAVWGATEDNPVSILLDGEEVSSIDHEGLFTFEWSLRGSHQLLARCRTRIFEQATFNVRAPPPPAPVILLDEFNKRLESQFTVMLMWAMAASGAGAWMGLETLKKTKIQSRWVLPIPGIVMGVGTRYLPDLYMLIPWAIVFSIVYWYAKPYARELTLLSLEDHQVDATKTITVDDDGKAVIGVSPRYWRHWFIRRKDIKVVDEYQVTLRHKGLHQGVVMEKLDETDTEITVNCSKALAELIRTSDALKKATNLAKEYWERNLELENLGELLLEKEVKRRTKANVTAIFQGMEAEEST